VDDLEDHLTDDAVSSDPLEADTDDDGLDDGREFQQRSDPTEPDTDDDGVSDGTEATYGGDPTAHDAQPPSIELTEAEYSRSRLGTDSFELIYNIGDPGGLEYTTVRYEGEDACRDCNRSYDDTRATSRTTGFETNALETGLAGLVGAAVTVVAVDENGNRRETLAVQRSNFYGELAGRLDEDSILSEDAAKGLGGLSGFIASWGAAAKAVKEFLEDPLAVIEGLQELRKLLQEENLLETLVDAMIESFKESQDRNNPYDEESELYDDFALNWYAGYAMGFLAKAIVGYGAWSTFKSIGYVQRIGSVLKSTKVGKVFTAVKQPIDRTTAFVTAKIAQGVDRAVSPVLSQARSLSSTYRVWRLQRQVDSDKVEDLSDTQRQRLGEYLSRTEDTDFVENIDGDTLERLLSPCPSYSFSGADASRAGTCPTAADWDNLGDTLAISDRQYSDFVDEVVDNRRYQTDAFYTYAQQTGSKGVRLFNQLNDPGRERLAGFIGKAPEGSPPYKLINELGDEDPDALKKFFEIDADNAGAMRRNLAQLVADDDIPIENVAQIAKDAKELESVPGVEDILNKISKNAQSGEVETALDFAYELRVGADYGSSNVRRLSADVTNSDREINIVLDNGLDRVPTAYLQARLDDIEPMSMEG
jgi:hypothetical protein